MSVITFPSTLDVEKFSWSQQRKDLFFESVFGSQSVEISSPVWNASITALMVYESDAGPWQSLIMQLRGKVNQLALHNLGRPVPRGNFRGSPTFNTAPVAGDTTLSIVSSGQAGKTLLAGDFIGFGSTTTQQVVMVLADATADGSGIISVTVEPPLRNAFASGAEVTWDKPKALFRRKDSNTKWDYESDMFSGIMLDLIEDWRT